MNKTEENITLKVGKGCIRIENSALKRISGKNVCINIDFEKGPCNDDACQVITKPVVTEIFEISPEMTHLEKGGVSIYLPPVIYKAIDAGRQENVSVIYSRGRGRLVVKGFSFLQ